MSTTILPSSLKAWEEGPKEESVKTVPIKGNVYVLQYNNKKETTP